MGSPHGPMAPAVATDAASSPDSVVQTATPVALDRRTTPLGAETSFLAPARRLRRPALLAGAQGRCDPLHESRLRRRQVLMLAAVFAADDLHPTVTVEPGLQRDPQPLCVLLTKHGLCAREVQPQVDLALRPVDVLAARTAPAGEAHLEAVGGNHPSIVQFEI